jgi:TonB family protein
VKSVTFAICLFVLVFGISRPMQGQGKVNRSPTSSAESGTSEQDGLNGPVRRIRIETAKVLVKDSKVVEAPRVLREITTYDANGLKIDSVVYSAESNNVSGKEQYQYDQKGNIVEMVLRTADGSLLSKKRYDYEFDEFGNWRKMTSAVALYESGKLSYEPVEATYRMISYYYDEAVARLPTSRPNASGSPKTAATLLSREYPRASSSQSPSTKPRSAIKPVANSLRDNSPVKNGQSKVTASAAVAQPGNEAIKDSPMGITVAAPSSSSDIAKPIKHVPMDVLKSAAIQLPQPEYPQAAMLTRAEGNVEVQVLVDENGAVMSARATSGPPLLMDVAEAAARKARFSKAKLSLHSSRVYSVIKYTFKAPASELFSAPSSKDPSTERKRVKSEEGTPVSKLATQPAGSPAEPNPTANRSFYEKGLTYLALGRPAEAVEALKQAVQVDPNDAAAYAKLGLAYSGLHQYQETVAVLQMAIRIKREVLDAEAYYQLGHAYIALSKNSDALEAFRQALYVTRAQAIDPGGAKDQEFTALEKIHYSLALAYHNMGSYGNAIKELQQVLALEPKLAEAHYGLALSYIALGDRRSAEKQLKILSSLNTALAEKVANALSRPSPILPPGVTEGRP